MCVMDVRPSDSSEEITQALTHNLSTVQRDLEMTVTILKARGEHASHARAEAALDHLNAAYVEMLDSFGKSLIEGPATRHYHSEIGVED